MIRRAGEQGSLFPEPERRSDVPIYPVGTPEGDAWARLIRRFGLTHTSRHATRIVRALEKRHHERMQG